MIEKLAIDVLNDKYFIELSYKIAELYGIHSVNCVFSLVKRLLTFVFKKEHVDVSNI